jgi:arylsulfatase A-like enzyme
VLASGCGEGPGAEHAPRLVVLYATCSLNRDFLSPYDPAVSYTPALERFGRDAVVFERHQTESGQSGTAFASLLSATQAAVHGVFEHPSRLSDDLYLLTEAFGDAGFDVHTWLAHPMASAALNYAQGVSPDHVHLNRLDAADDAFLAVLDRLHREPGYRALVVTNFTVTHGPYRDWGLLDEFCRGYPSECVALGDRNDFERHAARYTRHHIALSFDFEATAERLGLDRADLARLDDVTDLLYKLGVHHLDRLFGAVVDAIDVRGLADESLIAFTSDHGEVHVRENVVFRRTHGFQLTPEVLNVALLVRGPGLQPRRYAGVTRSVDVFPSLAGLAGVSLAKLEASGTDLSPALRGEEPEPSLLAFSHTALFPKRWWARHGRRPGVRRLYPSRDPVWMWVGVREGDVVHKLRHGQKTGWESVVFDLAQDRGEQVNLFRAEDPSHARTAQQLMEYKETLLDAHRRIASGEPVSVERQVELLRSLGYIE